ncbi:MAG TPA: hypothetical protein VD969_15715 [Symbiobacteriaceae bacterium]|nr:hypothetical protein [Symbiobacteriaceae bacterium]
MNGPLSLGWAALTRYPVLFVIPVIWELAASTLVRLLLGPAQAAAGRNFTVKFLLPPSLPAGAELIGQGNKLGANQAGVLSILLAFLALMASAFVTAGYLHLLQGALRGTAPTWEQFVQGVNRFGGRLLQWHLLLGAVLLVTGLVAVALGPVGIILLIALLLAAIFLFLVEWLIVVQDMSLGEALSASPGWVRGRFGDLFPIALVSVGLSAGLSLLLSGTGLNSILLASPLWGWFGTWLALAVTAVVAGPRYGF